MKYRLAGVTLVAGAAHAAYGSVTSDEVAAIAFDLEACEVVTVVRYTDSADRMTIEINNMNTSLTVRAEPHSVRATGYQLFMQDERGLAEVTPSPTNTFHGSIDEWLGAHVAGGTIAGQCYLMIAGPTGDRWWVEPLSRRLPDAASDEHVLYRDDDITMPPHSCGNDLDHLRETETGISAVPEGGVVIKHDLCHAMLAIDTDVEYFENWGSIEAVENRINIVISIMNFPYSTQIGVEHEIVALIVRTEEPDPYLSVVGSEILDEMRAEWIDGPFAAVDRHLIAHFSGKNIESNDAGLIGLAATIGGIASGANEICVTENDWNGSLPCSVGIATHETGHLWNGIHCACPGSSMQFPCLNNFDSQINIPRMTAYRQGLNSLACNDVPCGPDQAQFLEWDPKEVAADFGGAIDMTADGEELRAIIGASRLDASATNSGTAFVFETENGTDWHQSAQLLPLDAGAGDNFGIAVSIAGEVAAVGAYLEDEAGQDAGAVYAFRLGGGTWREETKLLASDGSMFDRFGSAVDIDGDRILVGAPFSDFNDAQQSGAAYVFEYDGDNWIEDTKLLPDVPVAEGRFGDAVAIQGDTIVVGATGATAGGDVAEAGSVYVFESDGEIWTQVQHIAASNPNAGDEFGHAIELADDVLAVGAPGRDTPQDNSGVVLMFRRDESKWKEVQVIVPELTGENYAFGDAVALGNGHLFVGAPEAQPFFTSTGLCYVFLQGGDGVWTEFDAFASSDLDSSDEFGFAIAANDEVVLIGAPDYDVDLQFAFGPGGAAFVYTVPGSDCNSNGAPDACDIEDGTSIDEDGDGVPDECASPPTQSANIDDDGDVDFADLLALLGAWGDCPTQADCPADLDQSGTVGFVDLLQLLSEWAPQP